MQREPAAVAAPHARPAADVIAALASDARRGLDDAEAARRLAAAGPNVLPEPAEPSALARFAAQFRSVLVALLVAAAAVCFALGEHIDATAIVAIVLLNAVLGAAQERRAAGAIAALRRLSAPTARVRRGGDERVVDAARLVPGDVVVLEAGDRVPADLRIVAASGLSAVESALTGESDAVPKDAAAVAADAPVADRRSMAWTGTTIAAGAGAGVVVATGTRTELGRIAALVHAAPEEETPLQRRLRALGGTLTVVTVGVVAVIAAANLLRGTPALETLLTAIGLAVAAVPEGLPAVVTIALAISVRRMSRRGALVRRLAAVETLGSTTVVCTDKTGTLTEGRLSLRAVAAPLRVAPWDAAARDDAAARALLRAAVAASTARLVGPGPDAAVAGDPTEGAILAAAREAGVEAADVERASPPAALLPFDAARRRMAVLRADGATLTSWVKGAPESVLPLCDRIDSGAGPGPFGDAARRCAAAAVEALAAQGLRVLAVATRPGLPADPHLADAETSLVLLGFVGLRDAPRPGVAEAVAACRGAGIRTVMITGDHPGTALAVARDLGIASDAGQVTTGAELDALDDAALAARCAGVRVFARTSPEQKLRVVRAFQALGGVVAMTGDGVNDAPALRAADIGVAMGRSGTDVAKDASAMVVTDDDFPTIVAAVEEGRAVFENLRKTLLYLLSGNAAQVTVMAGAAVAGLPVPLLPTQLLWMNLVTDGLPALALATDPAEPGLLSRPPRPASAGILDRSFAGLLAATAALGAACALCVYAGSLAAGVPLGGARAAAFSTLVVTKVLAGFAFRSRDRTLFEVGAWTNARLAVVVAGTLAAQAAVHLVPPLGYVLHTEPVTAGQAAVVLAVGLVPVTAIELWKLARRRVSPRRGVEDGAEPGDVGGP